MARVAGRSAVGDAAVSTGAGSTQAIGQNVKDVQGLEAPMDQDV